MKRRARTIEDKKQRKEIILKVAQKLFFDRGFNGTTIDMITEKAGVSTGTFYLYYKNKIEIYKALQEEGLDILISMIEKAISSTCNSSVERITQIARTYIKYYFEYREYFDIMAVLSAAPQELKENKTEISRIIDHKTFKLLKLIEGVFKDGIERGDLKNGDAWRMTIIFWGLMDGLILLDERKNIEAVTGKGIDELLAHTLEMVYSGIIKQHNDVK